jgi:hypothetical protein
MRKYFALVRFFYHKDPEEMHVDELGKILAEMEWLSEQKIINVDIRV